MVNHPETTAPAGCGIESEMVGVAVVEQGKGVGLDVQIGPNVLASAIRNLGDVPGSISLIDIERLFLVNNHA